MTKEYNTISFYQLAKMKVEQFNEQELPAYITNDGKPYLLFLEPKGEKAGGKIFYTKATRLNSDKNKAFTEKALKEHDCLELVKQGQDRLKKRIFIKKP